MTSFYQELQPEEWPSYARPADVPEDPIEAVRQELLAERKVHLNALQDCDLALSFLRDHVAGNHNSRSLLSCPICE